MKIKVRHRELFHSWWWTGELLLVTHTIINFLAVLCFCYQGESSKSDGDALKLFKGESRSLSRHVKRVRWRFESILQILISNCSIWAVDQWTPWYKQCYFEVKCELYSLENRHASDEMFFINIKSYVSRVFLIFFYTCMKVFLSLMWCWWHIICCQRCYFICSCTLVM